MTALSNVRGGLLRPIERRIRRLSGEGVSTGEIARRFRIKPETVERVRDMSELHQRDAGSSLRGDVLTPIERRVLRWRAAGVDHDDIAAKFQRSNRYIRQVERLAHHRLQAD